jgi:site-specific DNA-methyltransferase (adenine-specific)
MREQLKRIIKPKGASVLFGSQPFTSALVMSNPKWFKYEWVWVKNRNTNFLNAHKQPMRNTESVMVFNSSFYFPQDLKAFNKKVNKGSGGATVGTHSREYQQSLRGYPNNTLNYKVVSRPRHPTQKPVALLEYLIKTYTHEGETVLDFTFGSGTTGVACANLNRHFVGIEKEPEYFEIAQRRINEAINTPKQLELIA